MRKSWIAALALLLAAPGGDPRAQEAATPAAPAIQVPEGFEIERVAGPPLVERPIMASFDDEGRLYVTDSAGVNLRGAELAKNPPHRIRLLVDSRGRGIF